MVLLAALPHSSAAQASRPSGSAAAALLQGVTAALTSARRRDDVATEGDPRAREDVPVGVYTADGFRRSAPRPITGSSNSSSKTLSTCQPRVTEQPDVIRPVASTTAVSYTTMTKNSAVHEHGFAFDDHETDLQGNTNQANQQTTGCSPVLSTSDADSTVSVNETIATGADDETSSGMDVDPAGVIVTAEASKREAVPLSFYDENAPPPTSKLRLEPEDTEPIRYEPNLLSTFSASSSPFSAGSGNNDEQRPPLTTTTTPTIINNNPWNTTDNDRLTLFPADGWHRPSAPMLLIPPQASVEAELAGGKPRTILGSRSPSPIGEEREALNKKREMLDLSVQKIQTMNQQQSPTNLLKTVLIYNTMRTIQDELSASNSGASSASSSPPSSPEDIMYHHPLSEDELHEDEDEQDEKEDADMDDDQPDSMRKTQYSFDCGGWGSFVSSAIGGAGTMDSSLGGGWPTIPVYPPALTTTANDDDDSSYNMTRSPWGSQQGQTGGAQWPPYYPTYADGNEDDPEDRLYPDSVGGNPLFGRRQQDAGGCHQQYYDPFHHAGFGQESIFACLGITTAPTIGGPGGLRTAMDEYL